MKEIRIEKARRGMPVLLLTILAYILSIALLIVGIIMVENRGYSPFFGGIPLIVIAVLWMLLGWIFCLGLKVLKPQEAFVLTLFGKYVGTLREPGFFFVNPFCTSVNPAAKTKLSQSGDVGTPAPSIINVSGASVNTTEVQLNNKISLKMMTLNNNRQKINDCLGNPVEIGIAVIWRVVDTAKAVFDVDNFKEYLSLQCDSALRNIVRIYPYDVAPNVDTTGDGIADEVICITTSAHR